MTHQLCAKLQPILLAFVSVLSLSTPAYANAEEKSAEKPNIVLLLADDLGYGELGSYGQEQIETPVLDMLAANGARFTNFYSGAPVCSPARAVLMTGLPSHVVGIRGNSGFFDGEFAWQRVALKPGEVTLAERLRLQGYQTAMVGKWHLDDANDLSTWAIRRGFQQAAQSQWTMRAGGTKFNGPKLYINGNRIFLTYRMEEWNSKDEFHTAVALNLLDKFDRDEPFFLYMSYRAPHGSERAISNKTLYADRGWPEAQRMHAAKITLLDRYIGHLLKRLDEMGELDNTIILFTSDNGPHWEGNDPAFFHSSGPLKGIKRDLYEGGIRVPLIAYWSKRIQPMTVDTMAGFVDIMPTLGELSGYRVPDDAAGQSLLPTLLANASLGAGERSMHWEFQIDGKERPFTDGGFRQAARMGKWKAVRYGVKGAIELYDLERDIGETSNVAGDHPELVRRALDLFLNRVEVPHYPYGGIFEGKPYVGDGNEP